MVTDFYSKEEQQLWTCTTRKPETDISFKTADPERVRQVYDQVCNDKSAFCITRKQADATNLYLYEQHNCERASQKSQAHFKCSFQGAQQTKNNIGEGSK